MSYRKCAREGCILPALGTEGYGPDDGKYKYCYHDEKINIANDFANGLVFIAVFFGLMILGLIVGALIASA